MYFTLDGLSLGRMSCTLAQFNPNLLEISNQEPAVSSLGLSGVAVAHGSSFGLGVYVWCPSGGLLSETWPGSCHVMVCSGMSRLVMEWFLQSHGPRFVQKWGYVVDW